MKLFVNRPSPYGRKVLVVMHEKGLADEVELVPVDPWQDPPALHAATPVGKVPALLRRDGTVLTESMTICAYLDAVKPLPALMDRDPWDIMGRVGLARGIIDAAFVTVLERRRPPVHQWGDWIARQAAAIARTVRVIDRPADGRFDLGDISLACAFGYLDFRLPESDWRTARPDLAAWFDAVSGRPSMQASTP